MKSCAGRIAFHLSLDVRSLKSRVGNAFLENQGTAFAGLSVLT